MSEDEPATACEVLECNLDDMTPELVGVLTQRLFDAGALDVTTQAIMMKKQRPGVLLQLLETSDRESLLDLIFRNRLHLAFDIIQSNGQFYRVRLNRLIPNVA